MKRRTQVVKAETRKQQQYNESRPAKSRRNACISLGGAGVRMEGHAIYALASLERSSARLGGAAVGAVIASLGGCVLSVR